MRLKTPTRHLVAALILLFTLTQQLHAQSTESSYKPFTRIIVSHHVYSPISGYTIISTVTLVNGHALIWTRARSDAPHNIRINISQTNGQPKLSSKPAFSSFPYSRFRRISDYLNKMKAMRITTHLKDNIYSDLMHGNLADVTVYQNEDKNTFTASYSAEAENIKAAKISVRLVNEFIGKATIDFIHDYMMKEIYKASLQ